MFKRRLLWAAMLAALLFGALTSHAEPEPLRIGLTGKYPPFNFYDDTGTLTGFDVDVARHVCREVGRPCEFVPLQWDGILAALLAGKIDLIIGSMAITAEREKQALFSVPYYESGAQIFAPSESIRLQEAGLRIGVTLGTTYESAIRKALPEADVRTYKGDTEILQDINVGRLDAMVTDRLVGGYMIRNFGARLVPVGEPLFLERIGIPARPEERELIAAVNGAIHSLRSSEAYGEMADKYFGVRISSGEGGFSWGNALLLLFKGLWATVKVSVAGLALGLLLSLLLGGLMISGPGVLPAMTKAFTDFVRSTPFLIQLLAVYFGLPALGLPIPAFLAAVVTIGLHSSAYLAEVLVSGYFSVPGEQRQAARLLGLSSTQTVRHIVFPQMIPVIAAPSLNTIVAMVKDSAIVSVISVYELTMQTQQIISATYRPFEFYLLAAGLYALITYPLLLWGRRWAERPHRKEGHYGA